MAGVRVRHATVRSAWYVVPVPQKPYYGLLLCPTCHVSHVVKHVHLLLDDVGSCLVSEGVLGELRLAGLPGLEVVGSVNDPPPLNIRAGVTRHQIDSENRRVQIWAPGGRKTNG